jgi:large subunit ribosomal protein L13
MKTSAIRKHEPACHFIDANGKVLGRLSTEAANVLRGKNKISFLNHMDCGDHVVIINAGKVVLTGNKLQVKAYYRHSGHPGGLSTEYAKNLITEDPAKIIEASVKGMLPKNKLQGEWLKRLHVYAGAEHPHMGNVAHLQKGN